jgi:hypothetical protein
LRKRPKNPLDEFLSSPCPQGRFHIAFRHFSFHSPFLCRFCYFCYATRWNQQRDRSQGFITILKLRKTVGITWTTSAVIHIRWCSGRCSWWISSWLPDVVNDSVVAEVTGIRSCWWTSGYVVSGGGLVHSSARFSQATSGNEILLTAQILGPMNSLHVNHHTQMINI